MTVTEAYNEALLMAARIANERDSARAELVRLRAEMGAALVEARAEVERLSELCAKWARDYQDQAAAAEAERDRLAAVLADTPETLARVACAFNGRGGDSSFVRPGDLDGARAVLAALRARAGQP